MGKRNGPVVCPPDGQHAAEGPQAGRIVRDQEKAEPARRASLVAWVSLLIVWVVWGSTYLAIKVGVETIPPLLLLLAAARNLAFSAYGIAVRTLPTATVATYAYVNPVIAVLLGTLILNERLTPAMLGGGALIVAAGAASRRGPR
jgi:drug/metabolite transporter (DMT)-like permease